MTKTQSWEPSRVKKQTHRNQQTNSIAVGCYEVVHVLTAILRNIYSDVEVFFDKGMFWYFNGSLNETKADAKLLESANSWRTIKRYAKSADCKARHATTI